MNPNLTGRLIPDDAALEHYGGAYKEVPRRMNGESTTKAIWTKLE